MPAVPVESLEVPLRLAKLSLVLPELRLLLPHLALHGLDLLLEDLVVGELALVQVFEPLNLRASHLEAVDDSLQVDAVVVANWLLLDCNLVQVAHVEELGRKRFVNVVLKTVVLFEALFFEVLESLPLVSVEVLHFEVEPRIA